jgi:hypothetical protein
MLGNSWVAAQLAVSQEGLSFMGLEFRLNAIFQEEPCRMLPDSFAAYLDNEIRRLVSVK